MVDTYTMPLTRREKIAENTVEIALDTSEAEFTFAPGQFIMLTVPNLVKPDERGDTRSFSLASPPSKDELVTAYRVSDSGYKQTLQELDLGETVTVNGPFGHFTLPENPGKPCVFLAGGIGITPFRSMIRHVYSNGLDYDIRLVYANRSRARAAYHDEFKTLAREDVVTFHPVTGDITAENIHGAVDTVDEVDWFIAGPPDMVRDMRHVLIRKDVPGPHIHTEAFSGY